MWQAIEARWHALTRREQMLLLGLGVFLTFWLLYVAAWRPLQQWHDQALRARQQAEADWHWLVQTLQRHPLPTRQVERSLDPGALLRAHLPPGAQLQLQGGQWVVALKHTPVSAWHGWVRWLARQGLSPQSAQITLDGRRGVSGRLVFAEGV